MSGRPPSRSARCRSAQKRSTSSRSRSKRGRTCPATSTSSATRRPLSRASSARAGTRCRRALARTRSAPCPARAGAPTAGRARPGDATSACLLPVEGPLAPDVDVGDHQDQEEHGELGEAEPGELMENDTKRIQEDDLDVEDDEEHRRQVEADGEALAARWAGRDARLERDPARPRATLRAGCEDEREDDHRDRNQCCEQRVDEERQPVVEHVFSSRQPPGGRNVSSLEWVARGHRKPWSCEGDRCYKVPRLERPFGAWVAAEDAATMDPWQPLSSRLSSR